MIEVDIQLLFGNIQKIKKHEPVVLTDEDLVVLKAVTQETTETIDFDNLFEEDIEELQGKIDDLQWSYSIVEEAVKLVSGLKPKAQKKENKLM